MDLQTTIQSLYDVGWILPVTLAILLAMSDKKALAEKKTFVGSIIVSATLIYTAIMTAEKIVNPTAVNQSNQYFGLCLSCFIAIIIVLLVHNVKSWKNAQTNGQQSSPE